MAHGGADYNGICDTFIPVYYLLVFTGPAPAIDRLGINPYQWGTECLSGDVRAGDATSFPIALGMVNIIHIHDIYFNYVYIIIIIICAQNIARRVY